MCIIVCKEKGKEIPSRAIFYNCFSNNSDGAGLMYIKNKKVIIEKGFMTFDKFYKRLMELDKEINLKKHALVCHFRIATSGNVDGKTCHPFPISNKKEELQAERIETKIGMVHNGIIRAYSDMGELSDTQKFVQNFVYNIFKIKRFFTKNKFLMKLIEKECENTKLAFLEPNEHITYVGNFQKDENGIKYSNGTYAYNNDFKYNYNYYKTNSKYYDDFDIYNEIEEENDFDDIYFEEKENLAFLDDTMFYFNNKNFEYQTCTNSMVIDKDYNLFEIIHSYGNKTFDLKFLDYDVYLLDEYKEELTFNKIKQLNQ